MGDCIFAHKVIDRETGEIRYWSIRKGRWCGECKGLDTMAVKKLWILEGQIEVQGEMRNVQRKQGGEVYGKIQGP